VVNSRKAGAIRRAEDAGIEVGFFGRAYWGGDVPQAQELVDWLSEREIGLIALAGFLRMVPKQVLAAFPGRMLNIHPALLPAFGGPGMYGIRVHEAVWRAGCRVSGPTVHIVDERYDHGPILLQRAVNLEHGDGPEEIAARVLKLEHQIYPEALALLAYREIRIEEGRVLTWPKP